MDGPFQFLDTGADRAAGWRKRAVQLEAAAARERMAIAGLPKQTIRRRL